MKALPSYISITIIVMGTICADGIAVAAPEAACGAKNGAYPSFCSIPRPAETIGASGKVHDKVLDARLAGRDLVDQTAPSTYSLDATRDFAERAITEAAPPPPLTTASQSDPEAFAKAAKATAVPLKHPN